MHSINKARCVTIREVASQAVDIHNFFAWRSAWEKDRISLFTWSKQKWLLWRVGFYPANQSNLKSIQRAMIGWKAGPRKEPLVLIM